MEPELQAKHPDSAPTPVPPPTARASGSTSRPFGFHAMVRRPDGVSWFVEPATNNVGEARVLSFAGRRPGRRAGALRREAGPQTGGAGRPGRQDEAFSTPGGAVTQRTFRLAFLTDPTYAAFAGSTASHAVSDPRSSPPRPP